MTSSHITGVTWDSVPWEQVGNRSPGKAARSVHGLNVASGSQACADLLNLPRSVAFLLSKDWG